jgi:uncharacterized repeat protein (TIGR01451 family)
VQISGHTMNNQASTALAVGLIAIPVAAATAHPVAAATAHPVAAATARPGAVATAHPAASGTAPVVRLSRTPGLTISVTDGRVAATTGDRLTYTVSVRDTGIAAAPRLKITQTLSPGLQFVSASDNGVATAGQVAWHASLPAGSTQTFRVTAMVIRTPARELRLAAVACVTEHGSSRPLVCAAHLDDLPAAAAAGSAARSGSPGGNLTTYLTGGLTVFAAGLLTVIAGRRLRLRRRPT